MVLTLWGLGWPGVAEADRLVESGHFKELDKILELLLGPCQRVPRTMHVSRKPCNQSTSACPMHSASSFFAMLLCPS